MSQLFSKSALQQAISATHGHDLSEEIAIVNELYKDYLSGNTNDETRYEQRFNNLFFWQLLWYEENTHRHPKASTPVGSKIADVWLGFFEEWRYTFEGVKVVVELKWSGTLLDKKQASYGGQSPVDQGFGYKISFKDCPWLLVSNFASIRLYRDNKQDFEIWTLEQLVDPSNEYYHLRTLLGLLRRSRLIAQSGKSYTETLLSEVRIKQEQITKDFYKQYKTLRFELINDIRYHNPETHVETVVEKAQKIIDRIIFIHFCEDKGLLPEGKLKTNVIKAREADFSPWDVLKRYFKGVDSGSDKLEIPHGYNGGLFHNDPVLNDLEIGDAICHKFIDLGNYSFDDELSVNILGHIFEQSISDIEQLKGELLGEEITTDELVEKKESKRKKDGIFYTPEYIVDYIVQNSLMKYLEEKETACLEKVGKKWWYKTEIEAYQAYQHILQTIKVLDPACGSGAFLVKVFDYLYAENKRVGQIVKSLFDDDEIYKSILRNNIYGVDLNPESVEITKLSLWLKSAQKGKKLNNLDDNIKCGNSLIDDPAVAGERAFDRNKEFSDIMGAWGFDVIVMNPPYIDSESMVSTDPLGRDFIQKKFNNTSWNWDIYIPFIEQSVIFLKEDWYSCMITPDKWLSKPFWYLTRKNLLNKFVSIVMVWRDVFEDAKVDSIISSFKKTNNNIINFMKMNNNNIQLINIIKKSAIKDPFDFDSYFSINLSLIQKIENQKNKLSDFVICEWACATSDAYKIKNIINEKKATSVDDMIMINTWTIDKYNCRRWKKSMTYLWDKYLYPIISKSIFEKEFWNSYYKKSIQPKLIIKWLTLLDACGDFNWNIVPWKSTLLLLHNKENILKSLLSFINSKLPIFYIKNKYQSASYNGWISFTKDMLNNLPIPKEIIGNGKLIDKADLILSLNKELHDKTDSFLRYISSKFWLEKLSTKLSKFYDYDFATFLKELKWAKLSMSEEAELMEFFDTKKSEIISLKNKIDATDREIDEMVFELYGLTDEEKKVVMGE